MAEALARSGYRMPAEWEPHEATWIAWPHAADDWPGKFAPIPWVYTEIVRHLHVGERVGILVPDEPARQDAAARLARIGVDLGRVDFHVVPTDRSWTRDSGPIFVVRDGPERRQAALTDWHFRAWCKYDNWQRDAQVPRRMAAALGLPLFEAVVEGEAGPRPVVLEGGSIEVNGRGLLLTTEECLLSEVQQRNAGFSRQDYERIFRDFLGVSRVGWLGRGIAGDDTHGHIDDLARFVGPRTVVAVEEEEDPADVNYAPLQENLRRLREMTDADGRPLEVVPLPMPRPVTYDGDRLPASYANFYIGNGCVLVPTFNDPADRRALAVLADLFPDRTVAGIHAVDLVLGLGTLHCLTQQQPRSGPGQSSG
jgi:agmatine deiminase